MFDPAPDPTAPRSIAQTAIQPPRYCEIISIQRKDMFSRTGLLGDLERALRFPDLATTVLYLDLKLKRSRHRRRAREGTLRAQRPPRRRGSDPGPGEGGTVTLRLKW